MHGVVLGVGVSVADARLTPEGLVGVGQSLHVSGALLVDPGGEEALGFVDLAGPGGPVIHVHTDLYIILILLDGGQSLDLLQAGIPGLAGGHAAIHGNGAAIRHSAAGGRGIEDLGHGAGATAQELSVLGVLRVEFRIQHFHEPLDLIGGAVAVFVESADVLEDIGHFVDGVVSPLRSGAVAGDALHIHADLHAATVAPVDAAVGRLGGDHELDLAPGVLGTVEDLVDDVLPAHTVAVLLLHGADHHDLIAFRDQAQILHDLDAVNGGGHAALLIGAAPAVDHVLGLIALVGVGLPVGEVADAHGVDVGVDGDDLLAVAHPADDVAETVDLHLVIAQMLHLSLDAVDDLALFAAFTGVRDHFPQEAGHVRLIILGRSLDRFKIHIITLHDPVL